MSILSCGTPTPMRLPGTAKSKECEFGLYEGGYKVIKHGESESDVYFDLRDPRAAPRNRKK